MNISWQSQQGQKRRSNNDAVAIGYVENCVQQTAAESKGCLLAIVVDAAEKTTRAQAFAQHWANTIIYKATHTSAYTSPELLIELMHGQQKQLRRQYLHDIASYCLLRLELDSGCFQLLNIGDCQAGIQHSEGIGWLMTPHHINQHYLTRSLNAKRFLRPDIIESTLAKNDRLLLCTDGYWYEHLQQKNPLKQLADDASVLTISHGAQCLTMESDAYNLFASYR
ncbi:MAG: protein phosphatase 2C domain-containing protein [Endozoicomonadaceae bacterium]|nr:protein phosphatase 2C domain-containing protein [Endozoicomonadaceae bacterium]